MIEDEFIELGQAIYDDLGSLDDLPVELANTIANVYLRYLSLFSNRGFIPKKSLFKESDMRSTLLNFASNYSQITADKTTIKEQIDNLRRLDRYKDREEYDIIVDYLLDIYKYDIKNASTKTFFIRKIERKFKKYNVKEIPNLFARVKRYIIAV